MRVRALLCGACFTAIVSVLTPSVALAADGVPGATAVAATPAADRVWVQYLAQRDPRSLVRIAAWQALLSSDPDAAIAQFLTSGYDYAVRLSAERKARNADFAKRVLATFTADFAPEVHAAAQFAVNSRNDADRERFANGGFEAAKQRDAAARQARGDQAAALSAADRAFVTDLAGHDPGAQVRVSAAYAVRTGASDDDLVEFFTSGWAFGARLDLEAFRQASADDDARWRVTVTGLLADAAAAEEAAKNASAELARANAVSAWQAVGRQAAPAESYWDGARRITDDQAANWAAVLAAANSATGPNWAAMTGPAGTAQADWTAERDFAVQQAAYWNSLLQQALDGEQRVRAGS
ncbi:hypothetical protein Amsp01_016920 [Amycolatopsis sp. NBRC 101858]|uniref:hypothetical protein n=1 Tax=Amycolatopsis sp. NBRC 101858 TaxID=3032200 RepID=UPI0024A2CA53|nr:hypothetical protein [Amycolatopsis sp. NBRC 101858]GLY35668.1 hypothetical protein Amsp01_016920 [Amycolatopsis sp. NBRC 101858]